MTLEISFRKLLRPGFFSAVLAFALLMTLPSVSSRAVAQQPDNDDINRPSAEKPDKDRDRDKDKDRDRDKIRNRDNDRDRDKGRDRDENRARGQQAIQRSDNDINRHELESFDGFLDSNPEVARELARNPSLIDDQNYVNKHRTSQDTCRIILVCAKRFARILRASCNARSVSKIPARISATQNCATLTASSTRIRK